MLKLFKNVKGVKNFQPCKFDVRVKNEGKFISLSITDMKTQTMFLIPVSKELLKELLKYERC